MLHIVITIVMMVSPSWAREHFDDVRSIAGDLKDKILEEKKSLLDAEIKKRGVLGVLYEINKNLNKITSDVNQAESQLREHRKTISIQAKRILELNDKLEEKRKSLRVQLRTWYKLDVVSYAKILLSSRSTLQFFENLKFLGILTKFNSKTIDEFKSLVRNVASEQYSLQHGIKKYSVMKERLVSQLEKVEVEKGKQEMLLKSIEQDREKHLSALKEWREAGEKLEARMSDYDKASSEMSSILRKGFLEQKGEMHFPVLGKTSQSYGIMKNQKFKTSIFHKGLFFNVGPGSPVSAICDGKVAYAGWVDGFGQTLIIDHGDHYYSLYAHNSILNVATGAEVKAGSIIAKSGSSGSLRGSGLYFEIRHFSETLDPKIWLRKRYAKNFSEGKIHVKEN